MAAADFNVSKLKGALVRGGARPSLFEFTVSGLPADTAITTGLDNIKYFCQVSALPPLTVSPIEKMYFGRTVKIPGDMVFGDLTTTIYQTETGTERASLNIWMDEINGHASNVTTLTDGNFMGAYSGTIKLTHYDKEGSALMEVEFIDAWPQSVSEIALSYDTASDIEQFDVTWAYQHYKVVGKLAAVFNSGTVV
jgi:hypothetical protein